MSACKKSLSQQCNVVYLGGSGR